MLCINSVHDRGAVIEIWGPGYIMTIEQEKDKKQLRDWIKEGKHFAEVLGEETDRGIVNYLEYMVNNSDDWNDVPEMPLWALPEEY